MKTSFPFNIGVWREKPDGLSISAEAINTLRSQFDEGLREALEEFLKLHPLGTPMRRIHFIGEIEVSDESHEVPD